MKTIILAAGQGFRLGGYNKLLLKNPLSGKTILENYIEQFQDTEIFIVVGYNAVKIINTYPELNYIFNEDWNITKDSYSLGLALDDEPSYVIHSDIFVNSNLRDVLDSAGENCALTMKNDSRTINSFNCKINGGYIRSIYQGRVKSPDDPQLIDAYKITSENNLRKWKQNCLANPNLYIGQNLFFDSDLNTADASELDINIIKTPNDFINYINSFNLQEPIE